MINKRYKDLIQQYFHRGESTPLTLGTLVVCAFCFFVLIVAVFSRITFYHPWFSYDSTLGFNSYIKEVLYSPQLPALFFMIYILGRNFSLFVFIVYLIVGLFFFPVFTFGGGTDYFQTYFFGYLIGDLFAIILSGNVLKKSIGIKSRMLAILVGVFCVHIVGFIYCIFLAIFKVIDFSLILPIFSVLSLSKIMYDLVFCALIYLVAPYIKNVFWICMQPLFRIKKQK